MFFRQRKSKAHLSREAARHCVPLKHTAVKVVHRTGDSLRLSYPLSLKPWMVQLLKRLNPAGTYPPVRQLELDALGTQCWELMDGKRTFAEIVELFSRRRRVHPKEAEAAVARFLRELGRRGIIGMKPKA